MASTINPTLSSRNKRLVRSRDLAKLGRMEAGQSPHLALVTERSTAELCMDTHGYLPIRSWGLGFPLLFCGGYFCIACLVLWVEGVNSRMPGVGPWWSFRIWDTGQVTQAPLGLASSSVNKTSTSTGLVGL